MMAFVIDNQGSHRFEKDNAVRSNNESEESDDDFLFIPLKSGESRTSYNDLDEYLELDDSYPSFGETNMAHKKNKKNKMDLPISTSSEAISSDKCKAKRMKSDSKLSNSTTLQPGLEKLECVPSYLESKRIKQIKRKAERERTKGSKWFNLPAPEVTEEMKNDIEALQMRSALDPKHFYKKNDMKHIPKYFQIGKVVDSPADFYSSRIPKKERKRTLVDDLLADADFQKQTKRRYKEIISERQKTTLQYVRQKRRLMKKKSAERNKSNTSTS